MRSGKRWKRIIWVSAGVLAAVLLALACIITPPSTAVQTAPLSSSPLEQQYRRDIAKSDGINMNTPSDSCTTGMTEDCLSVSSDEYDVGGGCYPPNYDTEEYSATKEQGFLSTSTNPLSTVSSDVDTASYCNLRRMLSEGRTLDEIPDGAVRIEEMLNYFRYDYPAPAGDDVYSITAHVGECPWNNQTKLLTLGFATGSEEASERLANTHNAGSGVYNLVFLIDTSGSMEDYDKLPLLKDSLNVLVDNLDANDRVSIVTYAGSEKVVLEGASGSEPYAIKRAIDSLEAGGFTNGEAGLDRAYKLAEENLAKDGVNRIILCSDGDLNVGMTSESDLQRYVEEKRGTGIYLSVLGFGTGNYKDNKMETLADHGNGSYNYIDCIEEAQRVFDHELSSSLAPLADDTKIQVEFNPQYIKGYRLIGYENRALTDAEFEDDSADAGDVGPDSQFTVAYEIVPADSAYEVAGSKLKYSGNSDAASMGEGEWLTCSLRYKRVGSGQSVEQQLVVNGNEGVDDDWRFASSVIELGMIARNSEYAGSATVDNIAKTLRNMPLDDEHAGFLSLVDQASQIRECGTR